MNYEPDLIKMRKKFPDAHKEVKQLIEAHPYPKGLHPVIIQKFNMSLEMLFWAGLASGVANISLDNFSINSEN